MDGENWKLKAGCHYNIQRIKKKIHFNFAYFSFINSRLKKEVGEVQEGGDLYIYTYVWFMLLSGEATQFCKGIIQLKNELI